MTGTSLELAAKNLSQVEKLGEKTKVYILAILKTTPEQSRNINPLGEITYPLGTGFQPNDGSYHGVPVSIENSSNSASLSINGGKIFHPASAPSVQPPQTLPGSQTAPPAARLSTQQPEMRQNTIIVAADLSQQPISPMQGKEGDVPGGSVEAPPTTLQGVTQQAIHSEGTAAQHRSYVQRDEISVEPPSARDLKAYRNFAVVKMSQPGDNPWDLGSARLNLETVMGTSLLDWLLPLHRSPCCSHESLESQFQVGPKVDMLRAAINSNQLAQHGVNGHTPTHNY